MKNFSRVTICLWNVYNTLDKINELLRSNGQRRKEMELASKVRILEEFLCFPHRANALWKGMNTSLLPTSNR